MKTELTKSQKHKASVLAVMFRVGDPNLGHVSTLEDLTELGMAYLFGVWRGTPRRHKRERNRLAESIATQLEELAL